MLGVPMAGYFLLLLLFFLFFSASLYFGYREWRRPSDAAPLTMDVDYVRVENYFGRSFRSKMQEWLAEPQPNGVAAGDRSATVQRMTPGGERLLLLPGGRIGNREGQEEIIHSQEDLTLAGGALFRREIYCRGSFATEAGVRLQSVAADGDMVLGANNDVARWVDAQGAIVIRGGTVVGNRASSGTSIEMERGVSAQSLYAPMVSTAKYRAQAHSGGSSHGEEHSFLPGAQSGAGGNGSGPMPRFLEGVRCVRLGPGTWLVQDDLSLPAGTCVEDNLIVKGTLTSGSRCAFLRDVKAARVELGAGNHVLGNLAVEGSVQMGAESFVGRNIAAGGNVRLAAGARVGRPESLAAVSATGEILLEENVTVCGKLSASRWVRTV